MAEAEPAGGDMKIAVSPDRLECRATVRPPGEGGAPILPAAALQRLTQAGVVFGVDEERLSELVRRCQQEGTEQEGVVATGRVAVPGQPARLEILAQPPDSAPWASMGAAEHVSYHFPAPILSVREGQVVAYKTHAVPGQKGMDVLGHEITVPPVPDTTPKPRLRLRVEEDGATGARFIAAEDGELAVDEKAGAISVVTEHLVGEDVTPTTGDLIFVRDVIVRGNVVTGAVVKAGGNVTIVGRADGAMVEAAGNVEISQGIIGSGQGVVQAGGNVSAAFVEHATIRAGGDVTVRRGVLDAHVSARGSVYCTQGRGTVIGGVIRATHLIEAKKFGTAASPDCVLVVGTDYTLLEKHDALRSQIAQCHHNIQTLDHALGPVTGQADLSRWPEAVRESIRNAAAQRDKQRATLEALVTELREVERQMGAHTGGEVRVLQEAQPGTRIEIREHTLTLNDLYKYCRFYVGGEDDGIVSGPLT